MGGVVGIIKNEAALTHCMVTGPETARLLNEYDEKHSRSTNDNGRHHEQIPSVQKNFLAQVKGVTDVIEGLGNPFSDTSTELYTVDNKVVMPDSVLQAIRTAEDVGKTQYQKFVKERINDKAAAFNDSIQKNSLPQFNSSSGKKSTECLTVQLTYLRIMSIKHSKVGM